MLLEKWSAKWRQPFNADKTIYIRFANSRRYKNLEGNWENIGCKDKIYFYEQLQRSKSHKVLGVIIQHDLMFNQQFDKMEKILINAIFHKR